MKRERKLATWRSDDVTLHHIEQIASVAAVAMDNWKQLKLHFVKMRITPSVRVQLGKLIVAYLVTTFPYF